VNDEALVALDETSPFAYLARAESEVANPTHIDLSRLPIEGRGIPSAGISARERWPIKRAPTVKPDEGKDESRKRHQA